MGAGKKPVNIFKGLRCDDEPREILNWRFWFAVFSFAIMGAARGIDEGLISGTLATKNFQNIVGFNKMNATEAANVKGNVAAMVQIGSVAGALLAFVVADKIGRLWSTRQLCLTWILGIVIFMTNNGRLGQVYAGRFIAGIGIGETCVIGPVYLSEISPRSVRGLATCMFSSSVYLGILLAYWSSYGSSLHIDTKSVASWIVPQALHLYFASIILVLSFFNYESPRYLIKKGKSEAAIANLARIRGLPVEHEFVQHEISQVQQQLQKEQEATLGQGWFGYVKEIFCIPDNLYRLCLGIGSQLFAQWSGAGSITLYAPDFFALVGVAGNSEKLFATCIFGIVKFISGVMCALFLVDVIGRKRSLSIGIFLQAISMVYIASFLTAVPNIDDDGFVFTSSQKSASTGAIVMIYLSGFGWAMGWNSMQYLLNAEIYPLRIRAICSSLVMSWHFVQQYGNSRAVPVMLLPARDHGLSPKGTFWMFAVVTIIGGIWAWLCIPETANLSLEQMDQLFKLKWWQIGTQGRKFADQMEDRELERRLDEKEGAHATEVEVVTGHGRV